MNGLGILLDAGGRDRYEARTGQAHGGSTSYWGGRRAGNLGLLIDAGGDEDHYSLQGRGNGATWFDTNVGIFSDD